MEILDCIKSRRSVRVFNDKPIEKDVFEKIIDSARFSPSWKNGQIARYNIVTDKAVIEKLATETTMGFDHNKGIMLGAPAVLVLSYITGRTGYERDGSFTTSKGDAWEMFDAGIAAQTFCLCAHNENIGTVIMGIFDEEKVQDIISLPQGEKVGALIALGYYDTTPDAPNRKDVENLLRII
ncbi:MAG: nitroreductase family protein [Oscillospiraceae bacterium]|nr:nitroreductase family protein [Oscillospiraceae bacterium]